ncbi:hypothetical protein ACLMJK_005610 [Lecanora helva]
MELLAFEFGPGGERDTKNAEIRNQVRKQKDASAVPQIFWQAGEIFSPVAYSVMVASKLPKKGIFDHRFERHVGDPYLTWYRPGYGFQITRPLRMSSAAIRFELQAVFLSSHQFSFRSSSTLVTFCQRLPEEHREHLRHLALWVGTCGLWPKETAHDDRSTERWERAIEQIPPTVQTVAFGTSGRFVDESQKSQDFGKDYTSAYTKSPGDFYQSHWSNEHFHVEILRSSKGYTTSTFTLSPIQVTIRSSNGTDLTLSTQILHSHLPLASLQKRSSNLTQASSCSPYEKYVSRSWCDHKASPQAFENICTERPSANPLDPHEMTFVGRSKCAPDQICVGGSPNHLDVTNAAFCVATDNFVHVGKDGGAGRNFAIVTAGFDAERHENSPGHVAVEAVVTKDQNVQTSLIVKSLVIQAQAKINGVWKALPGDRSGCLTCSSVAIRPMPEAAQRVKIDVVLQEDMPSGTVWLASYPY